MHLPPTGPLNSLLPQTTISRKAKGTNTSFCRSCCSLQLHHLASHILLSSSCYSQATHIRSVIYIITKPRPIRSVAKVCFLTLGNLTHNEPLCTMSNPSTQSVQSLRSRYPLIVHFDWRATMIMLTRH